MVRLAIFDCDGTLVDSGATIERAMARAFAAEGIAWPGPGPTRRVIGLSLAEAMAVLVPDVDALWQVRLADRYRTAFGELRAEGPVEEPLFPGVRDALDALEAAGWLLGIATGKSDRGLAYCLDAHGLAGRFVTLQTADRHPSKPHPSMVQAAMADAGAEAGAMIGDTSFDMGMAVAAGVDPVGVAWGYHPAAELLAAGARIVAAHPADLPRCSTPHDPDPWRLRFRLLVLTRLYGLALLALGLVLWRTDWLGFTSPRVGQWSVVAGVAVVALVPVLLRRRWRRRG